MNIPEELRYTKSQASPTSPSTPWATLSLSTCPRRGIR